MPVELLDNPFDPWQKLSTYQTQQMPAGKYGATATFVGTMRDFNEGDDVCGMYLEHYPGMTETQLNGIIADAMKEWPLLDAYIVHRIGEIHVNDPIVLTAVWSAHRKAAFEACRFLMEALKSRATFWKKEQLSNQADRWVAKNTEG